MLNFRLARHGTLRAWEILNTTRKVEKQDTSHDTIRDTKRHDLVPCCVGGDRPCVGAAAVVGYRRRSIQLAIISSKIAHLYLTRRESLIKLANSYVLPVYFLSTWHGVVPMQNYIGTGLR